MKLFRYTAHLILVAVIIMTVVVVYGGEKAQALSGNNFNPARIIDDSLFFNKNTMNTGDIQNFLNAKVPTCRAGYTCLKNYSQNFSSVAADSYCGGITGGTKSAADIIFNVAQACGVNPQTILVLLQKEQSLVTDDWPVDSQYRSATGFGCPDNAACDSQYYGFFNQVYRAARQFKRYVALPSQYNYAAGRNSYIAYNPNGGCGGSNVTIQNGATAALYNYTPYQPNAAALANLYGTGDGCSAYGNRNFWRMFNDWFGPTTGNGYVLALNQDDNTQWIIYSGVKQYISSADIIDAYGLGSNPIPMSNSYLSIIPSVPPLTRLFHLAGSPDLYFADSGKKYYVSSQQMKDAFGFTGQTESYLSADLFNLTTNSGYLTYAVKSAASPSLYMVDGPNNSNQIVLRQYSTPDIFHAWEGDADNYTTLSSSYFDTIDNAIGSSLTNTKASYNGNEYQVIAGQRMSETYDTASLYPGVAQSISSYTYNRLVQTAPATHLIRSASSPDVYLIDGGTKHHLLWSDLLVSWSTSTSKLNIVNNGFVNLIPTGSDISNYIASNNGQYYVIDGNKTTIPSSLNTAYSNTGSVYSASDGLMNLFQTSSSQATGFIKGKNSPQVYLLDNSGKKRHIEYPNKLSLWSGSTSVTNFSDGLVNSFTSAASPGLFVSDGTNEYVMENGQKLTISPTVKADWGLSSPQTYTDGTLSRFSTGGSLYNTLKSGSLFYLIKGGVAFVTIDQNIANAWNINGALNGDSKLISSVLPLSSLTRFVKSNTTNDLYVIDGGNWYKISPEQRANLGNANEPTMTLDPANAPNSTTDWSFTVVKDASGKHYVIDGAKKRSFANSIIQNHWTGNGSLSVPTVTNGFLNLLPNNGTVERAIKGSAPAVYSAENGTKRWIQSPNTYNQYYAPFVVVSDTLINALPSGVNIP